MLPTFREHICCCNDLNVTCQFSDVSTVAVISALAVASVFSLATFLRKILLKVNANTVRVVETATTSAIGSAQNTAIVCISSDSLNTAGMINTSGSNSTSLRNTDRHIEIRIFPIATNVC